MASAPHCGICGQVPRVDQYGHPTADEFRARVGAHPKLPTADMFDLQASGQAIGRHLRIVCRGRDMSVACGRMALRLLSVEICGVPGNGQAGLESSSRRMCD